MKQKIDYIHNNPVIEGIVKHPQEYLYSSARNYAEIHGLLQVTIGEFKSVHEMERRFEVCLLPS